MSAPMLSYRRRQVLAGLAAGKTAGEIGRTLYVSEATVRTHLCRIYERLGATNAAHAVAIGYSLGLLKPIAAPAARTQDSAA